MMIRVAVALSLFSGCVAPGTHYAGAAATATQQPPATGERVSGQIFIDHLVAVGYACKDWSCWSPTPSADKLALSNWLVTIAYDATSRGPVGPVYVESGVGRAVEHPCARFDRYLRELGDANHNFEVTCDDESQMFFMTTTVNLESGMAGEVSRRWLDQHVANRTRAWKLLASVGAIRPAV